MGSFEIDLLKSEYSNNKRKKLYPIIVQVGVGGTGSNLAQQVAQMMSLFGQNGYYCLADADDIEKKTYQTNFLLNQM